MKEYTSNKILSDEEKKEIYIATIVHDLKNPLNGQIIALEQLYKEKFGNLSTLQKEILKDIINSSKFMLNMLNNILSVHKFESGNVVLNKTFVNIDKLIVNCLKNISALADENFIYIEYLNNAQFSAVFCDENYIRRVILNMLNNIISYSYKHSKAFVILRNKGKQIEIDFKNQGYPLDNKLKEHIFEKYNSGKHKNSGTGLGLYFCKIAIEAHNGTIELKTNNSDIEFSILLPIENL